MKKRLIAAVLLIVLLVSAGVPTMANNTQTVQEITGFANSGELDSISITSKTKEATLIKKMPETISVYLNGSSKATKIAVTWESVGNYTNTEYHYYQFNPVWNDAKYNLSYKIKESAIPYIAVNVNSSQSTAKISTYSTSTDNRDMIYNFLKNQMGFNTAAACGVLANIYCESGYNPKQYGDYGTSYGICQWHASRFTNLKNWCKKNGYTYTSLTGQLNYLKYELTKYSKVLKYIQSVKNTKTGSYQAAYYWCYYFEIPANKGSVSVSRGNLAKNIYDIYKDVPEVTRVETFSNKPAKQTITSLQALSNGKVKVSYKKNTKVDGYQVTYTYDKSFKDTTKVIIKNEKLSSYTITGLEEGQTCYVKVRSYNNVNGKKVYGTYSTAAKVVVK